MQNTVEPTYAKSAVNDATTTLDFDLKNISNFPFRDGHCSSFCNHFLYIFGGVQPGKSIHDECSESHELVKLDCSSLEWKIVEAKGDLPSARVGATLSTVGNKLYLIGGLNQTEGWTDEVNCFNTETNVWTVIDSTGCAPSPRDKAAACVIDKSIYLFGGFGPLPNIDEDDDEDNDEYEDVAGDQIGADFGRFNDLFVFNTEDNSWSNPMHKNLCSVTARASPAMCVIDNHLVIMGGKDECSRLNDLHFYDTVEKKWHICFEPEGELPCPRSFHTLSALGKKAVLVGGLDSSDQHLNDVHIFDFEKRQWSQPKTTGVPLKARGSHSATVVKDSIFVYGGSYFNKQTQSMEQHCDVVSISEASGECPQNGREE